MKRTMPWILMAACAGALAQSTPVPASASDLINAAKVKAAAEKKAIFVKFEASW